MDVSCAVAALSAVTAGSNTITLSLSGTWCMHAEWKGDGQRGSSMGPCDGLGGGVSSEGGGGEGAEGGGGVGFRGNPWKGVGGSASKGIKCFAEMDMEGSVGVGLEGDGGEGSD